MHVIRTQIVSEVKSSPPSHLSSSILLARARRVADGYAGLPEKKTTFKISGNSSILVP
jgi:hypothetical protein